VEIYAAEGKNLEDTLLLLLGRNLGPIHHIYHDNFYNGRLAATLFHRNVSICGTISGNRGIMCDRRGRQTLGRGETVFWRRGDIMVQMWEDRRLLQMISMIHGTTVVNTGRKDRNTNLAVKQLSAD
jgi:hypothetical protein